MASASITGILAIGLYAVAALMVFRALLGNRHPASRMFLGLGLLAVLFHGVTLWQLIVTDSGIRLGLFPMASMITGCGAALVITAAFYRRLEWVSAMVFPLSALALAPALWVDTGYTPHHLAHGVAAHVIVSILAYAVLAIAAAHAVLLLIQHRQLKSGHIQGVMRLLPPVQVMEKMLFELILAGVLLLTGAILTGFLYLDNMFDQNVAHKTLLTLVAWGFFAVLLGGRWWLGWRAVTAVRLTLVGFTILIIAFFGSQLVLEIILRR